ncbi:MAG: DUF2207 domain-containing protein [Caldilineaceae bacterium]
MDWHIRWFVFLFTCALFFIFAPFPSSSYAQEKSLVWERFDVAINIQPDGSFTVAEQQRIHFTQGAFRFGTREIPIRNFDRLDGWAVRDSSGHPYKQQQTGEEPYTFKVEKTGASYAIHWYFPPVSNSSATYTLTYTVHGGLRIYPAGDQVWWKAIYGKRSFPVLAGRIQVTMPAKAPIDQWSAYINGDDARNAATAALGPDKQTITYELGRRLESGEEFEVRVQFPHAVVTATPPAWQAAVDADAAHQAELLAYQQKWGPLANFIFCTLGLLFTFGGPALLYAFWYKQGRDKPVPLVAAYLPEAPDDLAPGLVGTLLDERADLADILATVVDLARRNVISITADKGSTDFIYRRNPTHSALQPYEQTILTALFGNETTNEVHLSQVRTQFYRQFKSIKQVLYQALIDQGYFPHNPDRVRHRYGCLGAWGLLAGGVLGLCLLTLYVDLTVAGILPGIGLAITALGLLIIARNLPRKTDKGAEAAARWRAFKTYLQNIEKYSDVEQQKAIWDRWLPYAIAFGIDQAYIRTFEAANAPAPTWYYPSSSVYDADMSSNSGPTSSVSTSSAHQAPASQGASTHHETPGDHSVGGGLSAASRGLGRTLGSLSTDLGAMLTGTSNALAGYSPASRSSSSSSSSSWSSSDSGWSSSGGSFSGGGSSGGGGGGGGSGGFG